MLRLSFEGYHQVHDSLKHLVFGMYMGAHAYVHTADSHKLLPTIENCQNMSGTRLTTILQSMEDSLPVRCMSVKQTAALPAIC